VEWWNQSACLNEDPELFFPIGTRGPSILQRQEAKQVCGRCVPRDACLAWALADGGPEHGVWGGLDEEERRQLKRGRVTIG
jgi:WhiB family redox-sensing transcriptional regulator